MIISEVVISQMFTAYAEHIGRVQNGLVHTQYFCEECDQAFASAWGVSPGMNGYMRGSRFHCTFCGREHNRYVAYVKRHEDCPYKVRLSVKAFKDIVLLEVFYEAVYFDDVFGVRARKNGKETFRFDVTKQVATFSSHYCTGTGEKITIGSPFELDIFKDSVLRFFTADSLAIAKQKAELTGLLRELREAVQRRMEKRYKVKSLYVSSGMRHGLFLAPLHNIAFRVTFPDAPNLPAVYRDRVVDINSMWGKHMVTKYDFVQKAMGLSQKGIDFITAVITASALPNTAAVRREIGQNFFECGRLAASFDLVKNYDYAIRFHVALKNILQVAKGTFYSRDLLNFLDGVLINYGESGLVTIVENAKEFNLEDCIRLYDHLNEESRQDIVTDRVRLRDLHDWMAKKHRQQTHTNLVLNVPEHIVNRLSMQKEKLKFFLPKESIELLEAGAELHNCVASYGAAMKDHKKWIVLVADDKGKLAACLEVVGSTLVQAKLINNQPVAKNVKLNAEIIAWAKEANINIDTIDIKLTAEDLASRAC